MPYSLDELAKDIKGILKDHGIQEGSDKVCYYVQKALMDQNFIQNNLKDRDDQNPREILYEDPELGFCVCGHVYNQEANGSNQPGRRFAHTGAREKDDACDA